MKREDDRIISITDDIKWTGILDYDIKTFDIVMTTEYGTTYNSYFVNAGKKALIEVATYLKKLSSLTDPADISYIILDHTEPDHSGSLKLLLEMAPSATVVGSGNAIRYLEDIVNVPFKSMVVKDGDTIDLGGKTLQFIAAPNLHWPDSIYTYLVEDRVLFTCDSFGAHYCSYEMTDEFNSEYLDAFKYYFDVILKPFSRFMLKAIDRIRPLKINCICPGHGPILRKNLKSIVDLTEKYAKEYIDKTISAAKRHILITYVSAYGFTRNIDLAELEGKIVMNDAILVGSPTINQNTLLPVYKMFALINPIRDKGKLAGAFGSYGWSGEASKIILEALRNLKLKVFEEGASFKFRPAGSKEEAMKEYGRRFAAKFEEECAQKERG
jgi:flavorubredoxin